MLLYEMSCNSCYFVAVAVIAELTGIPSILTLMFKLDYITVRLKLSTN